LREASTADALYCLIAAFGVAHIGNCLLNEQTLISLLGGIVLAAVGAKIFMAAFGVAAGLLGLMG
jgi:hypothetical protein